MIDLCASVAVTERRKARAGPRRTREAESASAGSAALAARDEGVPSFTERRPTEANCSECRESARVVGGAAPRTAGTVRKGWVLSLRLPRPTRTLICHTRHVVAMAGHGVGRMREEGDQDEVKVE